MRRCLSPARDADVYSTDLSTFMLQNRHKDFSKDFSTTEFSFTKRKAKKRGLGAVLTEAKGVQGDKDVMPFVHFVLASGSASGSAFGSWGFSALCNLLNWRNKVTADSDKEVEQLVGGEVLPVVVLLPSFVRALT